jgi:hypothetical protein
MDRAGVGAAGEYGFGHLILHVQTKVMQPLLKEDQISAPTKASVQTINQDSLK